MTFIKKGMKVKLIQKNFYIFGYLNNKIKIIQLFLAPWKFSINLVNFLQSIFFLKLFPYATKIL
jgi:hypothetical protein